MATYLPTMALLKIRNARYRHDVSILDDRCDCYTCQVISRAPTCTIWINAVNYWPRSSSTIHNLRYYQQLMLDLRRAISSGPINGLLWKIFTGSGN